MIIKLDQFKEVEKVFTVICVRMQLSTTQDKHLATNTAPTKVAERIKSPGINGRSAEMLAVSGRTHNQDDILNQADIVCFLPHH